jgi:hypothetical protein
MKLPSLTRLPKNNRFNFQPRYYDPIKEEIEERTSRIKKELGESDEYYREHISSAFRRRARTQKTSGILQFIFIISFVFISFGYIYFGNQIFYAFLILIPLYIWMKRRSRS